MKPDATEADVLKLILANTDFAGVGDAGGLRGSVVAGSLYLAFHYQNPGEGGDQTSYEAAYVGYARKALARAPAQWDFATVLGEAALVNAQAFPASTSQGGQAQWWSVGTAAAGAGRVLYVGFLTVPVSFASGQTPTIPAGSKLTED